MKSVTVVMLVSQFPNIVQTYIVSAISGLQQNRTDVTIVAANKPRTKIVSREAVKIPRRILYINTKLPGIFFSALKIPFYSHKYWSAISYIVKARLWKKRGWGYFIKSLLRARIMSARRVDIMHSHNLTLSYDYLFIKELFSIPIITTFHGKEPRSSKTLSADKQQTLFDLSDGFLVNTNFAKTSLIELGCPEQKITVLPQGTDTSTFPFYERQINKNKDIHILTVGRLSIEKGQHIALQAISTLVHDYPNIRYHLVGDGPERESVELLINELQIQDNVTVHGYTSSTELKKIYNQAHIFILPSIDLQDGLHVETQGVVLQEAQASGLPVIASNVGGIPEVVTDGVTGLLFEAENINHLAEKIGCLIANPVLYQGLAKKGREDVEDNYNSKIITLRLLKIYGKLISSAERF